MNFSCARFHWASGAAAAQLPHCHWMPKLAPAGLVHQAAKLPTFEAGLNLLFRFVSTVTILQQTIPPIFVGGLA